VRIATDRVPTLRRNRSPLGRSGRSPEASGGRQAAGLTSTLEAKALELPHEAADVRLGVVTLLEQSGPRST